MDRKKMNAAINRKRAKREARKSLTNMATNPNRYTQDKSKQKRLKDTAGYHLKKL